MHKTLDDLEQDLRRAVEEGRFAEVEPLAQELCQAAGEHLAMLRVNDPARAMIASRILGVLDWAILMMLAAKSSCLEELNRVMAASRYLHQPDAESQATPLNL